MGDSQNLEGLLLSHETTLDSQTFVSHLLATLVRVLLLVVHSAFLGEEALNPLKALTFSQGSVHLLVVLIILANNVLVNDWLSVI